jgi:hypothetical protein
MTIDYKKIDFFDKNNKSILIYNPLSYVGHFDSWCSIFVSCLLQNGWKVCVVTKNSKIILDENSRHSPQYRSELLVLDDTSSLLNSNYYIFCRKILDKFNIFNFLQFINKKTLELNSDQTNVVVSFILRSVNFVARKLSDVLKHAFQPSLKINPINPADFADDIQLVVTALASSPSIVLNMYLDLYKADRELWKIFNTRMQTKWVGIHMDMTHTLILRPYVLSTALAAIYTINEPAKVTSANLDKNLNYLWLPDVTNTSLPPAVTPEALNILKRAAGRKIIFLGGAIGGTKNLSLWTELINRLNSHEWFFVQAGKVDVATLSADDLRGLKHLQEAELENVYISEGYLSDESIFNEMISISDVIWGVYRDFDRSSNILTKAALFTKPILVSDRYLMGQRVSEYAIGAVVSESDIENVMLGLTRLMDNPIPAKNFENYATVYSTEALSAKLDQTLMSLIN